MNKKFLAAIAVAILGAFSAPAFAQNAGNEKCTGTEQCAPEKCKKADGKKDCKKADGKKAECKKGACPFDGLNLTEQQKTQLQALNAERQQKAKAARKEAKEAKKQCDKECRAEYLAKVKAILTPEQYTQFLEQNYAQGGKRHKMQARDGKPGKGMKEGRPAKDNNAKERNAKPQTEKK